MSRVYQQIGVDEASKELLSTDIHKGLLRHYRLLFGPTSLPAWIQQIMESLLGDIDGVLVDIFVANALMT